MEVLPSTVVLRGWSLAQQTSAAAPGNLPEMQISGSIPDLLDQKLLGSRGHPSGFEHALQVILIQLEFDNHWVPAADTRM